MINPRAINHIGIAVRSLAAQREYYESVLGARYEGEEVVADQHVRVAFYSIGPVDRPVRLELLEPTSPQSPIAAFLEKRGEGLHHVAYTVSGIDDTLRDLKSRGVRLIDERPRPGAHGTRIGFLHPAASMGILTELCEPLPAHAG